MKNKFKNFTNKVTQKKYIFLFALLSSILWILLLYHKTGIVFETNDDRYISEILSGYLTGAPEAHTTYVNYLLCLPLSLLYKITENIAWYGWMLVFCQLLSYTVIGYFILQQFGLLALPFYAGILCSGVYLTSLLQYTSTAFLITLTGYVCYLFMRNRKKGIALFFVLELLGFFIRKEAMLLVQPLGLLVLLGFVISEQVTLHKNIHNEDNSQPSRVASVTSFGRCLTLFCTLILVLVIGCLGNFLGYHSADWKEYLRFNNARTEMFDYYGVPDYASAKHILDRYDITEAQYLAFCNYTILEDNLSADCLEELADLAKVQYKSIQNLSGISHLTSSIVSSFTEYLSDHNWKLGRIPLLLWGILLLSLLCCRRPTLFFPALGLWIGRTISWSYLLFRGRLLARVTIPLYLCEIILLLFIIGCIQSNIRTYFIPICGILFLALFLKYGQMQYRFVKEQNATQQIFIQSFPELQDYCFSHPENTYLIELQTLSYYRGNALSATSYQPQNSCLTGSWYSQSPSMKEKREKYLSQTRKTDSTPGSKPLFFIFTGGQEERVAPILTYLSEYTGHPGMPSDQFTVSHGGTYLVYCYE